LGGYETVFDDEKTKETSSMNEPESMKTKEEKIEVGDSSPTQSESSHDESTSSSSKDSHSTSDDDIQEKKDEKS
jgi:hypothetical protein